MDITPAELAAECARALTAWPFIFPTERAHGLPRGLLLAVGSRETNLTNEVGDYGNGHGVWQLDDRSHTPAEAGCSSWAEFDSNVPAQATYAAAMLAELLGQYGSVQAAAAAYNSGQPDDAYTTGHDYGADVAGRLAVIQQTYGTSTPTPAPAPAPSPKPVPTPEEAMATLNRPVIDIVAHGPGGYWLIAQDGGVFNFGDAPALVNPWTGKYPPDGLVQAATATPTGNGLVLAAADGGVTTLGDAQFHGSIPGDHVGPSTQPLQA